jgi:cytochrome b561
LSERARPARWDAPVIALHWATAALILALLALGLAMVHAPFDAPTQFDLYQLHKSLGFLALALLLAHGVARLVATAPADRSAAGWERLLAAAVQASLYGLGLAAILAGWLLVSASPLPIPSRFFDLLVIPNIASADATLFEAARSAHKWTTWAIAGLVALHVAGALKHHLLNRDDVLARMLPRLPTRGRGDGAN